MKPMPMNSHWLPLLWERAGVRGERYPDPAHERPLNCYWLPLGRKTSRRPNDFLLSQWCWPMNPLANRLTQTPNERPVDVVVLGGGPAGTATAIALARFGRRVTILERSHYESTRIGETLPPEIKRPLIGAGTLGAVPGRQPCGVAGNRVGLGPGRAVR